MESSKTKFSFIHFNDVYNIEENESEPLGGVARFKTAIDLLKLERDSEAFVFFSGDCFSPSILSYLFDGEQMVEPMNQFAIDVACIGNHELDYPLPMTTNLLEQTNFPWLISNLIDTETQNYICDGLSYYIIERGGLRFGFMGLAEKEWIELITQTDITTL